LPAVGRGADDGLSEPRLAGGPVDRPSAARLQWRSDHLGLCTTTPFKFLTSVSLSKAICSIIGVRPATVRILYGHYLPTVILTIIWYSITHSLFHSRIKTFFSANPSHHSPSFFFFRIHYMDSPDCLLLLLSMSVFTF